MPLLYVLRDRYLAPRRLLAALGVEGGDVGDVIDDAIDAYGAADDVDPVATDQDARRAQLEAFMAAT